MVRVHKRSILILFAVSIVLLIFTFAQFIPDLGDFSNDLLEETDSNLMIKGFPRGIILDKVKGQDDVSNNEKHRTDDKEVDEIEMKQEEVEEDDDYEDDDDDDVNGLKGWKFLWNPNKEGQEVNDTSSICKKMRARKRLKSMTISLGRNFQKKLPVFADLSTLTLPDTQEFKTPFGIKDEETNFVDALKLFTDTTLPIEITNTSCSRCVVVGSGGVIKDTKLGSKIDKYDAVIRVNGGPVYGFEQDVGTRTTLRVSHPEGAPQRLDDYDPEAMFALVVFKATDLEWAKRVSTHDIADFSDMRGAFWKGVARTVPNKPHQFRVLNPAVVKETAFDHVRFPSFEGQMFKNVPTTGTLAIVMAVRMCDTVDVAGFGFDLRRPNIPLHYYENTPMSKVRELKTHDLGLEKEFLRDLVEYGVIKDLTGGLTWV
ncbi:CMP-N-acetylneuraminate-beta-1,4-galactoside alpha-2,3-sialyltransferase-like [Glandiceps talaboti]